MRYLADTGVLLRFGIETDPNHAAIVNAVRELIRRGDELCYTPQSRREAWVVATRPVTGGNEKLGGYGLSSDEARGLIGDIDLVFQLLDDAPGLSARWLELVTSFRVLGKASHDTNLVAAMELHHISTLLTLNGKDFARFPSVRVLHPRDVGPLE